MALIKCRECGNNVSTAAAACPGCGAPVSKKQGSPIAGAVVLIVIVGFAISTCNSGDHKKEASKHSAAECAKDDIQCLGDKAVVAAGVYCRNPVERLAKHSMRWTDGAFEVKFSRFRWADKSAGTLTMIGDRAEFQNGFGAYTPVIYECDLAADGKTVLDARVSEGRLPQ